VVVEYVESFASYLNAQTFLDAECLSDSKIGIDVGESTNIRDPWPIPVIEVKRID
jgi:hypothetical protein